MGSNRVKRCQYVVCGFQLLTCAHILNVLDLSFPLEFGILAQKGEPNYERDGWLVGLVNAAPYVASALWCVFS